jgi:hypothetical protein
VEHKTMPKLEFTKFNLNRFWESTPTPLKYLLLIAVIVAASYFLFSKKVDSTSVKELAKMEQGIETTYQLVDKFDAFQKFQTQYNDEVIIDIKNIYALVTELNDNVNTKFNYLIKNSGKYNQDLIDKLDLLNQSFEKLSKAYQPGKTDEKYDPSITIKKIK